MCIRDSRYLEYLLEQGKMEDYLQKLVHAFNPAAVNGLMCRSLISVGWEGTIYDCDFNQMLEIPVDSECPQQIENFDVQRLKHRRIQTDQHCFGCTAGSGSGCLGATV